MLKNMKLLITAGTNHRRQTYLVSLPSVESPHASGQFLKWWNNFCQMSHSITATTKKTVCRLYLWFPATSGNQRYRWRTAGVKGVK